MTKNWRKTGMIFGLSNLIALVTQQDLHRLREDQRNAANQDKPL